ncbi:hypothetical protein DFJ58DRAFT_847301 [Suillus subalutaceus]|uniref:uncharacterized protein n=1 Tax=Suillus subalutaceus TaxID=48586 RepID=UPI001B8704C5|nr:uncharacterized protein DFJ58DRAFT_847301 [Suillus subalutaceus]KAG1835887.1 hypothetical protein DFJ58DRAFT_847301 [Suillus subalutaceus]
MSQDGTLIHHDNITKRMFKDLHQVVFSIIILRAWTLVPAILKAEAGHHIKIVAIKNNLTEAQQENPAILSLNSEIGSRGPIQLISLWKKCCFGYLIQANFLDPVAFNFSAFVLNRITLAQQLETRYEWLHYHDSLTALESSTVGQGSSISAYSSDPQLQHAFSADWNWASIWAFDPFYSSDLADDMEAANFFEEVILMTSQLATSWDIIFPQVRETINLAIHSQDACLVRTNHPRIFSCSSTSFSALPGIGVTIRLSNEALKDHLGNVTEPELRVCIAGREFDTAPLVLICEGPVISGLFTWPPLRPESTSTLHAASCRAPYAGIKIVAKPAQIVSYSLLACQALAGSLRKLTPKPLAKLQDYFKKDVLTLIGYGSQGHRQGLMLSLMSVKTAKVDIVRHRPNS